MADVLDVPVVLTVAAEFTARAGDVQAALALADRAVDEARAQHAEEWGPRSFRAAILLRLGRLDDAMADLAAVRPMLTESTEAVTVITRVLTDHGQADLAVQWLTVAVETMLKRHEALTVYGPSGTRVDVAELTFALLSARKRLRHDLGLPPDKHDDLANSFQNDPAGMQPDLHTETFWPRGEFERLLERWPALHQEVGETWDDHRAKVERRLTLFKESVAATTAVVSVSVDELVDFAEIIGVDPGLTEIRVDYLNYMAEHGQVTAWPPGRNDACWCGSGAKYKKCCLPRSRG